MKRFWPGPLTLVLPDARGPPARLPPPEPPARARPRARGGRAAARAQREPLRPARPRRRRSEVLREFPERARPRDRRRLRRGRRPEHRRAGDRRPGSTCCARARSPRRASSTPTAPTVLFVCTGNTDRSPLAAAILRRRLAQRLGCTEDDLEAQRLPRAQRRRGRAPRAAAPRSTRAAWRAGVARAARSTSKATSRKKLTERAGRARHARVLHGARAARPDPRLLPPPRARRAAARPRGPRRRGPRRARASPSTGGSRAASTPWPRCSRAGCVRILRHASLVRRCDARSVPTTPPSPNGRRWAST